MEQGFDYGNWIRRKNLLILGLCALAAGALIFVPLGFVYRLAATILFVILLISFLFPLYAYAVFSQRGGKFQERLYELVLQNLGANVKGRILDIGSGNGMLAVKLAQRHRDVEVVGIDYWGADWEYSKGVCERNALVAEVDARVRFRKGDAAALEFADGAFDGAISNLTFHEVRSIADKRAVLREALRIVKPGGVFVFVDYFYEAKYYGAEFEDCFIALNLAQVELKSLNEVIDLPMLLRHPKVLGRVGMLRGRT